MSRLALRLIVLLLATSAFAQSPDRTIFQTAAPWSPPMDIASDMAVVYGARGDFLERLAGFRAQGYETSFMTGVSWGGYGDYYGEGEAFKAGEVQTRKDGSLRMHGANVGYNVPTPAYVEYLKQYIAPAIDAGVRAIYMEEPEYWADTGWSEGFKQAWQRYYGEPWQAPDSSVDAQYKASRLKYELNFDALREVFQFAKARAREHGREIECHVPTHSLINYAHWGIVSPESHLMDIPECDGYIAQVWTGTARTPNRYRNVMRERTFEAAYFEYASAWAMVRPTGRKVWFLHDPIEDNPNHTWADYETNYEATVAASLLIPGVHRYEVMPWPDRVWMGQYPKADLERKPSGEFIQTEREGIPADFAVELLTVMNALNEMEQGEVTIHSGEPGIGVLVSDTLMFQRAAPQPSDHAFGNFYGIAMPLIKHGIAAELVQMETLKSPADLGAVKVLLLTYEGQKPLKPEYHEVIAQWVREGGKLIIIDDNSDPYHGVKEWWNQQGLNARTPRDALLATLGVDASTAGSLQQIGSGTVLLVNESPTALTKKEDGAGAVFDAIAQTLGRAPKTQHYLRLDRGPYTIAVAMEESTSSETVTVDGRFINLFDAALPLLENPRLRPGQRMLLRKLDPNAVPTLLAASARRKEFNANASTVNFQLRGPVNTLARAVLQLPSQPASASVDGQPAPIEWDAVHSLARIETPNQARWVNVSITLQ